MPLHPGTQFAPVCVITMENAQMREGVLRLAAIALFWPVAAGAAPGASLQDFNGTWVMRLGERNFFVLTLSAVRGKVSGTFDQPAKFSSTNSIYANIRGIRSDKVVAGHLDGNLLHFTVQNADDAADQDEYSLAVNGDRGELLIDGLPPGVVIEPRILERAPGGAQVATDWEPNRVYSATDSDVPCTEMKAIFDEDQRVRQSGHIDWTAVSRTDADRRDKTRKLLAAGALHTGRDYEEAAFVFQHGDAPQDYLLAHTLAMVAVSRGDATAIWIAAATLDRYLQRIGQKQIFGTQFNSDPKQNWTQEPYDRDLVSDALRQQLGVPGQATQARQLEAYRKQP